MNWTGERLTESLSGGIQRAASAQASRSTQSPSLRIRPLSSARRMKWRGRSAEQGVVPAHQRLEAEDGAAVEIGERLIVDGKLAAVDRQAQIRLELAALAQRLVHRRLVEAGGPRPSALAR